MPVAHPRGGPSTPTYTTSRDVPHRVRPVQPHRRAASHRGSRRQGHAGGPGRV